MDIWNSDFVLNTNATSSLVSLRHSFVHFRFKGCMVSVPYLLCHYTPTIEVYWNGPKSFWVSVRINKKVRFRASSTIPCRTTTSFSSNFNALTSRIVFSNDPAFALRTLSALETNASALTCEVNGRSLTCVLYTCCMHIFLAFLMLVQYNMP